MKLLHARNDRITGAGGQRVGSNHSLSVCKKVCRGWRHPASAHRSPKRSRAVLHPLPQLCAPSRICHAATCVWLILD